jgi:catechol 2,3-dioxygenase-like lactoylglutathione lyase family enzyme
MDDLTGRRDPGALTRRNALLLLSATVMMSPDSVAQPARPVIVPRSLNNVMIAVSDLERSTAFYQRLFGAPVRHGEAVIFRVGAGPQFFALMAITSGAKPGFLSYGMTVEDFDADRVMRSLADLGVRDAQITRRGDTPELFVLDANGIKVQLQDVAYRHGSGRSCVLHNRRFRRRASHGNPDRPWSRTDRGRNSCTHQAYDVPSQMASARQQWRRSNQSAGNARTLLQ